MDRKDHPDEITDGHKKHVTGQWRKDDPSYKELGQTILCFIVL